MMRWCTESIPTIAGLVPVTDIMTADVTTVRLDDDADKIVDLVLDGYIGCLPVVDAEGCPIGMITKRDLLEPSASAAHPRMSQSGRTAATLMLPMTLTLDEHATVLQAAGLMARQGIHHVVIVSAIGRVVGVVSSLDIICWLARNDGLAIPR